MTDLVNSSAEHSALADRVRMLEATLAAVTSNNAAQSFFEGSEMLGEASSRPTLQIDTSFDDSSLSRSFSFNDLNAPETDDSSSLMVPSIQITAPHGSIPSSPLAISPSSLYTGTTRASTPDPMSAMSMTFDSLGTGMLAPSSTGHARTPAVSQWAEVYDRGNTLQTPGSTHGSGWISRRSSISSFGGLDQGICDMNIDMPPMSPQTGDWNFQDPFDHSSMLGHNGLAAEHRMPPIAQAEALSQRAFGHGDMPIDQTAFKVCLGAAYDAANHSNTMSSSNMPSAAQLMLLTLTPFSLRMARCLAFLVLTIGSKVDISVGGGNIVLEDCYAIAQEQMRTTDFWAEPGAQKAASLLGILSSISMQ